MSRKFDLIPAVKLATRSDPIVKEFVVSEPIIIEGLE